MYRKKKFLIAWFFSNNRIIAATFSLIIAFNHGSNTYAATTHQKRTPASATQVSKTAQNNSEMESILMQAQKAVNQFQEYTVIQFKQEKFKNTLEAPSKMFIKYSKNRIYIHMLEGPTKNAEVLFSPQWNSGKAKVHPGKFPDLTLNLDPHGSRMLESQHHPIEHASLQRIIHQVGHTILTCKDLPGSKGKIIPSLHPSDIHLEFIANWHEKNSIPNKNEDIWAFAERHQSDPFLILATNGLDFGDSLPESTPLRIPLCYATRTVLILDKNTYFPKKLESYGEKGDLYERYEWQDLNLKPNLTDLDFDPNNKEYGF